MLMGMVTYTTGYHTIAYEDSYVVDYLISYLPASKKEYVISRYIVNILVIIMADVLFSIIYLLAIKLNIDDYILIDYKTNLYMGVMMSVILVSVFIPIILRLGIKNQDLI